MIIQLLTSLYQKIISLIQWVFNLVFGNWNYSVLFSWLPQDIQVAVTTIIMFLFGLMVIKLLKSLIPG